MIHLQWVFILQKWCGRRIADPSEMDCIYVSHHIPAHTRVLQEGAGAWLCGLWFWGDCSSCSALHLQGTLLGCIHAIPATGGSEHIPCLDLPSKLFTVTCDLQSHLLTLFLLFFVLHDLLLLWVGSHLEQWGLQHGLCRAERSSTQHHLSVNANILGF